MKLMIRSMKSEGLQPNAQTFAALLQASGVLIDGGKVTSVLEEMEEQVCGD